MARKTTDQGLVQLGKNMYGIGAADPNDAISLTNFGTLLAATTTLAAASNKAIAAFSATPTVLSGTTVRCSALFAAAAINGLAFTNITVHYGGVGSYASVYGGVDAQSFAYSGIDLTVTIDDTFSSV